MVGQTLQGIVLRALPEGQSLVDFGGQQAQLDLGQPLITGQKFLATVEQTSPMLVLKVPHNLALQTVNSTALFTAARNLLANLGAS